MPKGNLSVEHRVPVLNVLHLVALKHEFAWLSLAVRPHSSFCVFWLPRAPQCLACIDCPCWYKPATQMAGTPHYYLSMYILGVSITCGVNGMFLSDVSLLVKPLNSQVVREMHDYIL